MLTVLAYEWAVVPLNESFQADSYHHPALPFRIAYATPGSPLDDGWLLDNYDSEKRLKEGGRFRFRVRPVPGSARLPTGNRTPKRRRAPRPGSCRRNR